MILSRFPKLLLAAAVTLPAASSPVHASENAMVVRVIDGDTVLIQMFDGGEQKMVRLACIDAPEAGQPMGDWATSEVERLMPPAMPVRFVNLATDQYGRSVAELFSGNSSYNQALVSRGIAVIYPDYVNQCQDPEAFYQWQQQAQSEELGF